MAWHGVGAAPGSGLTQVTIAGIDMVLIRLEDEWHAVEDRCSHAGCSFIADGELDGTTLICNCHGSEFDVRTGVPLVMPANEALRTFPTRTDGGSIEVEV